MKFEIAAAAKPKGATIKRRRREGETHPTPSPSMSVDRNMGTHKKLVERGEERKEDGRKEGFEVPSEWTRVFLLFPLFYRILGVG